eukprot:TRINITY_DN16453_c0_g1_i4.p2 TRINITY_DN16453_c0_g1~~TRINITY_DN16453_c0_g1_i4.p2  ORF type:complete len:116 (-),score=3.79 TRINITY_DN16453_c0_g1_i4:322-669(-)
MVQLVPDLALAFGDVEREIENGQVNFVIVRIVNAIGVSCRDPAIAKIEQLSDLYKDNYKGLWVLLSILAPEYLLNCNYLENCSSQAEKTCQGEFGICYCKDANRLETKCSNEYSS